jgi:hypothetical protein
LIPYVQDKPLSNVALANSTYITTPSSVFLVFPLYFEEPQPEQVAHPTVLAFICSPFGVFKFQ